MEIENQADIRERYTLAMDRVRQIRTEEAAPQPFCDYFQHVAQFITTVHEVVQKMDSGLPIAELAQLNHTLYADILPGQYETSYGNPAYAGRQLGEDFGPLLCFLYAELRGMIVYAFEERLWDFTVAAELFLEVYREFCWEDLPDAEDIRGILYWYVSDYTDTMVTERVRGQLDPARSFAADILMQADLSDPRYLYRFGEYITDPVRQMAEFLNSLPQEEIDAMASTYTEGYRRGFLHAGIDLSKKEVVNIRYMLGFERLIRAAVGQFAAMGLKPVIYRSATHVVNKRQQHRIGYTGAIPNQQYDYDHRGDAALFLDEDFVGRKLRAMQNAYEQCRDLAAVHAGPAVVEVFGETPFSPEDKKEGLRLTAAQQQLQVRLDSEGAQIVERYIRGDERSFTIIAFPVPQIGDRFAEIFRETVRINTLDAALYEQIQQKLIDALDRGTKVHITGRGKNRTDLTVCLQPLADPETQTNFENCVADVNIPVGEVFTSPALSGTGGTLQVSRVFLNDLEYTDLELTFRDGMVTAYRCGNFPDEEKGKQYIRENVLAHHESLPLGEFAIGTNTVAYQMAKVYDIADKLPILIAEKMGPHFAVGDTCYSHAEDVPVHNPDGKEITARENACSLLRKTKPQEAYFNCHTDITIPYDELGDIEVHCDDGSVTAIIREGRFVLPGTEVLNEPLQRDNKITNCGK